MNGQNSKQGQKTQNICIPIKLYNKHIPSEKVNLECDYMIFGHYDGLSVGRSIFESNESIMDIWNYAHDNTDFSDQNRNFSQQILYAMRCDVEGENRDHKFWDDNSMPFLFLCIMQIGHVACLRECKAFIEKRIKERFVELNAERGDNESVDAICYSTFENNGLILAIKCSDYSRGAEIINSMHEEDACINYRPGEEPVSIKYTYTLHGVKTDILDKSTDLIHNKNAGDIHLYAIEKSTGSIKNIYDEICCRLYDDSKKDGEELNQLISRKLIAGNDDECIQIKKVPWEKFLSLYFGETPILVGNNDVFHDATYSIATHFLAEPSDTHYFSCDKTDAKKVQRGENVSICAIINENLKNIKKRSMAAQGNLTAAIVNRRLTYYKAMSHILNSMQKFEISLFTQDRYLDDYTYFMIFQPLRLLALAIDFVLPIENEGESMEEFLPASEIFRFLNGVTLIAQNSIHSDRQFMQVPDFNAIVYETPAKLNAYYGAFVKKAQTMLNNTEIEYGSIIVPGLNEYMVVRDVFDQLIENKRLCLIEIPERQIYDPRNLMPSLLHEIAHKVGRNIRCRQDRYNAIKDMVVLMIAADLLQFMNINIFEEDCLVKEVSDFIHTKLAFCIQDVLKKQNSDYNEKKKRYDNILKEAGFDSKYTYAKRNDLLGRNMFKDIMTAVTGTFNELVGNNSIINYLWDIYAEKGQPKTYDGFKEEMISILTQYLNVTKYKSLLEKQKKDIKFGIQAELNDVLYILSEIYADIISILSLKLSIDDYLNTIINHNLKIDQEELCYSIILIRMGLVVNIMIDCQIESLRWSVDDLQREDNNVLRKKIKDKVSQILMIYEDNKNNKGIFMESIPQILFMTKTRDIIVKYINKCIANFKTYILEDEEKKKLGDDLYQMYEVTYDLKETNIEDVIQKVEDEIYEYRNVVKEELIGKSGKK